MFTTNKVSVSALQELHQRLEQELDERKTEVIELREKLTQPWDRLCENHSYRDEFLGGHPGHSGDTLKAVCIVFCSLGNLVK
jgi:HPt (histidine-containing phosphotransfer) domain-containing protein